VSKRGHFPIRMCIGCRGRKKKDELMRFIRDREGTAVLDRDKRMSGRGFYLCPDQKCLKSARRKVYPLSVFLDSEA
jgi:predicted RNA-binding protein YlxR (DUF448 family)